MSDLSNIVELKETSDADYANKLIAGDWVLVAAAPGQDAQGYPFVLYSVGRIFTEARRDLLSL